MSKRLPLSLKNLMTSERGRRLLMAQALPSMLAMIWLCALRSRVKACGASPRAMCQQAVLSALWACWWDAWSVLASAACAAAIKWSGK